MWNPIPASFKRFTLALFFEAQTLLPQEWLWHFIFKVYKFTLYSVIMNILSLHLISCPFLPFNSSNYCLSLWVANQVCFRLFFFLIDFNSFKVFIPFFGFHFFFWLILFCIFYFISPSIWLYFSFSFVLMLSIFLLLLFLFVFPVISAVSILLPIWYSILYVIFVLYKQYIHIHKSTFCCYNSV